MNESHYFRSGDEPLLERTIPDHFFRVAERFPDSEAVVSLPQQRRLTCAELAEAVDRLARGLLGIGFGKGDRVGVWSTNNVEWQLLQMATASIGAILVTINPAYRTRELEYALRHSELHGLFTIPSFRGSDYVAMLAELIPELRQYSPEDLRSRRLPFLRRVVLSDPEKPEKTQRPYPGFTLWQQVECAAEGVSAVDRQKITASLNPLDPASIQYTSGTTGSPKGVVLTHHNILNNAWFAARAMAFTEEDRLCIPVPFYHCFGMVLSNLLCFSVGACAVTPCEHFDAAAVMRAVQDERCTAIHGVPTMFIALLEHPLFRDFDLASLRTGIMAGAPCAPALVKRVMEEMHCREILIGYGQTEASPLTHLTSRQDSLRRRTETVGRNLPHQEVKVVSCDTGEILPRDQVGEICFRGYHVMKGYYGDPDATTEAIDSEGWLHSGDLGRMDGDGYVQITGRLKEMIIRGGENICPREIEEVIFSHPKVVQVAVCGVPEEFYGEEVVAWIRLREGETADEEEIRAFCRDRIAHFKIPRRIWFVQEFPMTVTGKIQKFRMREITAEKLAGK